MNYKRIKTDRRDALLIARMLKNGEGEGIHIPTEDDEAARDLLRCRDDIKLDMTRSKQRLSKFLLRLGHRFEEKKAWSKAHREWMKGIAFAREPQRETFEQYYSALVSYEDRLARLDERIEEIARSPRYRERVNRLRCFKGIDYLTALALICEVGDFMRFGSAESFMAYLGLVPSENSSGGARRQGGITKAGNSHLRRLLIESSWHYRYRGPASAALNERRKGESEIVIEYADRALRRLQTKHCRLVRKGKNPKAATAAVARELAGFIWGMMTERYERA